MTRKGHPRTAWGERLLSIVSDGEWHDTDFVLAEVASVVPAGVALRTVEVQVNLNRGLRGVVNPRGHVTTDEHRVRSGQLRVARTTIGNWTRAGRLTHADGRLRLTQETA